MVVENEQTRKVSSTPTTKKTPLKMLTPRVTVKSAPLIPRVTRRWRTEIVLEFFLLDHIRRTLNFSPSACRRIMTSVRWRSVFFYLYTGQISFAPLRSQGVDSRSRYILENTTAGSPPPCSPKSIYLIANLVCPLQPTNRNFPLTPCCSKLNVEPLRELALKDIESKVSEENVVEELFSCITAK